MTLERQYYEIESLWEENLFSESNIERFKTTVKMIPRDVTSILDVGCGNGLFVHNFQSQADLPIRMVAIDRSIAALKHV